MGPPPDITPLPRSYFGSTVGSTQRVQLALPRTQPAFPDSNNHKYDADLLWGFLMLPSWSYFPALT